MCKLFRQVRGSFAVVVEAVAAHHTWKFTGKPYHEVRPEPPTAAVRIPDSRVRRMAVDSAPIPAAESLSRPGGAPHQRPHGGKQLLSHAQSLNIWCSGLGGAASAVNAKGAFWFCTYEGALNAELFVELLGQMMGRRKTPVHLVLDSLPAHKKAIVREYVTSTKGRLTLHFLPGYAPDLNPDELVWSHVKRTGTARRPLQKGEKLRDRIEEQLAKIQKIPRLVRSFFQAPSVAYIADG